MVTIYTTDMFPIIMDFTQVFAPNGNLPGDFITSVTSIYTNPSDVTIVSTTIVDSGLQLSIVLTGGNDGGLIAQQIYQIVAIVATNLGNIVTWQDQFQLLTPVPI
jgi:hypothetical protein